MGEVYRARDTRLNRDVALKVLPDVFASDSDRLARFNRERKSWPRSTIPTSRRHGLEDGVANRALVMELVDRTGPREADHKGPMPVEKPSPSPDRSPPRWKPHTSRGSSTEI